jgi:hypothetical protein
MSSYSATLAVRKRAPGLKYGPLLSVSRQYKRSSIRLKESKDSVDFAVDAEDATALRAALNSVLRDIKVIEAAATARIPQKKGR